MATMLHPSKLDEMTLVELDNYACKLARTVDSLELAYTDYNGDWIDSARRREWVRLVKLQNMVDNKLDEMA